MPLIDEYGRLPEFFLRLLRLRLEDLVRFFLAGSELVGRRRGDFGWIFFNEVCIDTNILFMAAAHHNIIIT